MNGEFLRFDQIAWATRLHRKAAHEREQRRQLEECAARARFDALRAQYARDVAIPIEKPIQHRVADTIWAVFLLFAWLRPRKLREALERARLAIEQAREDKRQRAIAEELRANVEAMKRDLAEWRELKRTDSDSVRLASYHDERRRAGGELERLSRILPSGDPYLEMRREQLRQVARAR